MSNSNTPLSTIQASLQRWYPTNAENTAFHLQQIYTALNDHNLAIISLNNKGGSGIGNQSTSTGTSGPTSITINNTSSLGGLGRVNLQSSNYTLTNDDAGALILVTSASPVTITCPMAVSTPFFCFIQNDGTADVTLVPDGGLLINGAASLTVRPEFFVVLFFVNNVSWDAATLPESTLLVETNGTPNSTQTLLNLVAGSNIALTESAGSVTIDASGSFTLTRVPHNQTGSRSFGTTYQNTTGIEMIVSGYGTTSGSSTGTLTAFIDTSSPPTAFAVWGISPTATIVGGQAGFNFTVPNNYFYRIVVSGAITGLGSWIETF